MGREQGDELPKNPPVYVRTDANGDEQERAAYSPVDEVNMKARGWVLKSEKPAGKRAPAAKSVAPQDEVAANERKGG
jgi:hypothetical protein